MKRTLMQNAMLLLLAAGILIPALPAAAEPVDRIAVVRIKSVDGLDAAGAPIQVIRTQQFVTGSNLRISRAAVSSLDGVRVLVLVDRRSDAMNGAELVQNRSDEVLAVRGDTFTIKGVDGRDLTYAVDILSDGSVDLVGPGDRIIARPRGEFKIWKIEGSDLMSRDRITLY